MDNVVHHLSIDCPLSVHRCLSIVLVFLKEAEQLRHHILHLGLMGTIARPYIEVKACLQLLPAETESFAHNAFEAVALHSHPIALRYGDAEPGRKIFASAGINDDPLPHMAFSLL